MRRIFFALVLLLGAVFSLSGQSAGPVDLILLLDTSSSMSSSYREVNNYLAGPFLKEFLRIGDTFHLVHFSDRALVDVSRRIEGLGDVQTVLGRILLAYPLESGSDVEGALSFAEQYVSTLPSSRGKKIVLVTDAGPSAALVDGAKSRFAAKGISLDYVPVPLTALPSSERPSTQSQPVAARPPDAPAKPSLPAAPPPEQTAAQPPAAAARSPAAAAQVPPAEQTGAPPVSDDFAPSSDPYAETAGKPADEPAPVQAVPEKTSAPSSSQTAEKTEGTSFGISLGALPYIIGIVILALLILGAILFFTGRDLHGSPNRAISRAAAAQPAGTTRPEPKRAEAPPRQPKDGNTDLLTSYAASQRPRTSPYAHRYNPQPAEYEGPLMLNLFVEDQNTAIGKRNIHAVKQGYSFTVGGGKSDFLIFLVPFPPHIGEIRCDGANCTFIPRKPKYFPDIGSQQVPDCIGKIIRIVSDKNYELHFRMERYEDPLRALNRLLHSINVPG